MLVRAMRFFYTFQTRTRRMMLVRFFRAAEATSLEDDVMYASDDDSRARRR